MPISRTVVDENLESPTALPEPSCCCCIEKCSFETILAPQGPTANSTKGLHESLPEHVMSIEWGRPHQQHHNIRAALSTASHLEPYGFEADTGADAPNLCQDVYWAFHHLLRSMSVRWGLGRSLSIHVG